MRRTIIIATVSAALMACTAPQARAAGPITLISTGRTATTSITQLHVAARGGYPAYNRAAFGPGWADPDSNGCDARNDVLRRDLAAAKLKRGSNCLVESGTLKDKYTGKRLAFQRGARTSTAVQIDHVVPVADAWRSGAWRWTPARRAIFYNDQRNLVAVAGPVNQAKSDKTAERYLPPINKCRYAATVIEVKAAYSLTVTPAERAALIGACK
jgi:Protein of unknown function (DUF1524)